MKTIRFIGWVIIFILLTHVISFAQSDKQLFTTEETSYLKGKKIK